MLNRFLRYISIPTQSNEDSTSYPTNKNEIKLCSMLADEMRQIGMTTIDRDVYKGYIYGYIDATPGYEDKPCIGFISHIDTAPACCGDNINPQIIEDYDGNDIILGDKTLSSKNFPHLANLVGRTLIVTDGNTLLGADDKAGVAEIMTAMEELIKSNKPHGKVVVAFTPDEEIGIGTDGFDIDLFGADFAYTVDGGAENIVENENFNAEMVYLTITGFNVHPGDGKDVLINALSVASEIETFYNSIDLSPRESSGKEGFHYLVSMTGDPNEVKMVYALRDFEKDGLEFRRIQLSNIISQLNEKYGKVITVTKDIQQYQNMKEVVDDFIVNAAIDVINNLGLKAETKPIRGGTDGAMLSNKGLPCPNLGTGGYAFHGPYEHITLEGMRNSVNIILGIIDYFSN